MFDVAACSDATRAQQTFEQIRQRVQIRDSWFDRGVYNADEEDILTLARTFEGDRALIVGHEPTISGAGYVLARENDRSEVARGVPTANRIILTFDGTWRIWPPPAAPCASCSPRPPGRPGDRGRGPGLVHRSCECVYVCPRGARPDAEGGRKRVRIWRYLSTTGRSDVGTL